MLSTLALALLPLLAQSQPPAPPQEPLDTYDLRCTTRVGEPVYVTTRMSTRGTLKVRRGSNYVELPFDRSVAIEHLDEFTSFDRPNEGDFLAVRRYVKWHVDDRRRVRDPEWNGVQLRLGVVGGAGSIELADRGVRKSTLDVELQRIDYTGAWIPLPDQALIGKRVDVDVQALGHLLHFIDGPTTGKAELVLKAVGPDRVATISGPLEFTRRLDDEAADEVHAGTCTLSVDLLADKLTRVQWKGDLQLVDAEQPQRFTGKAAFQCELAVQLGDAARKAGAARSVQRDRDWHFETGKLDFELPSHWFELESTDAMTMVLASALYGVDDATQLELKLIDVGLGGTDASLDAVLDAWRKDPTLDIREERSTTCALGRGKLLRIENAEHREIWIGLYPCGPHWLVRVRLIAPLGKGKELAPIWTRLEKSLRRPK